MSLELEKEKMHFVPLGGSNEIGINVNLYHYNGKWLMIDCGSGFADDKLPGVDMVVADINFILKRKKDLIGVVLTHAHEDHLGAIQFYIQELGCKIYATNFTINFLKYRLKEYGLHDKVDMVQISPDSTLTLDPFSLQMISLTHSAPEMQALMIRTPVANALHTGDWKFDDDPVVGPRSNEKLLEECGKEGVTVLVCDSTNVFNKGSSGSEGDLSKSLTDIIAGCPKMIVVTTFASNLARLDVLISAAQKAGRKVVLAGRSMHRMVSAAHDSGYLKEHQPFVDERDIPRFTREEIMVIATGCQGEPLAAVSKMTAGTHNYIKLSKGDTVIFSSKIIPGNEKKIFAMFNSFVRSGIEVITERDHFVHVSGHPGLEGLEKMYKLVNPKVVVPVHGEPVHLHEHVKFAKKCGIKQALEVQNGSVVEIDASGARIIHTIETGYFAVDGNYLLPTSSQIFKMRRKMRDGGVVIVSVLLDKKFKLAAYPVIDCPGVLDFIEDKELIRSISAQVIEVVTQSNIAKKSFSDIESAVRSCVKRNIKAETGKIPVIIVNIKSTFGN